MSRSWHEEEQILDQALSQPDPLLKQSLQAEEQARQRRRRQLWWSGSCAVLIGCLAVGALLITAPRANGNAVSLTQEGWSLWNQGKAAEAEQKFQAALALDGKSIGALNGLGWAQVHQGKHAEAQASFKKGLEVAPEHGAMLNGLGQASLFLRDYKGAEEALAKAAPTANAAWYGLARVYLLTGRFEEALPWLKKISALEANTPLYGELIKAAEAKSLPAELRQQIEPPDPALTEAWQLMNSGQLIEAKAKLATLLETRPEDAGVLNAWGFCVLNLGDFKTAQPAFETCLKLDPHASGAMNGLARCYKASGKTTEAIELWKKLDALTSFPNAGTVGLATTYQEQGDFAAAIPYFERLVQAMPDNAQFATQLAACREAVPK